MSSSQPATCSPGLLLRDWWAAPADSGLAFPAHGMLAGEDARHGGAVQHVALSSLGARLGGGTDEIQRNIAGERAINLPKEPSVDPDVPFSLVLRSTPT